MSADTLVNTGVPQDIAEAAASRVLRIQSKLHDRAAADTACFDKISHTALTGRMRDRIADKRVLALVKAFLHAGILTGEGILRDTTSGTPQSGIVFVHQQARAMGKALAVPDFFAETRRW